MIRYYDEFIDIIKQYELNLEEICIIGSTVLAREGFRENHDFDFAINSDVRRRLLEKYSSDLKVLPSGTICFTDDVQILQHRYGIIGITDDELFSDQYSVEIDGHRYAKIELEIAKKITRSYPKDIKDLKVLGEDDKAKDWDWRKIYTYAYISRQPQKDGIKHQIKSKIKAVLKISARRKKDDTREVGISSVSTLAVSPLYLLRQAIIENRQDIICPLLYLTGQIEEDEKNILYLNNNIDEADIYKTLSASQKSTTVDFPIKVGKNGDVCEKGNNLIAAVINDKPLIPIIVDTKNSNKADVQYKLKAQSDKVDQLCIDMGLYWCAVIWGSMYDYFEDIIKLIEQKFPVKGSYVADDIPDYVQLISDIYEIDHIEKWKILIKQSYLKKYKNAVCVVFFDVENPAFRKSDRTGLVLSGACADLKREIRDKFKPYLDDYIFDVIIHIGDNYQINKNIVRALKKNCII